MSWLSEFRKKQEELGAKAPQDGKAPPEKKSAKVPRPPKDKPKAEVVYKCGHTQPVAELKNHDCRQCQKGKRKKKGKGRGRPVVARLPQGSLYQLQYHEEGDRKWWSGTITVFLPAVTRTFEGEADSVHYLLDLLGRKFRDWEQEQPAGKTLMEVFAEEEEAAKRATNDTVIPPECPA